MKYPFERNRLHDLKLRPQVEYPHGLCHSFASFRKQHHSIVTRAEVWSQNSVENTTLLGSALLAKQEACRDSRARDIYLENDSPRVRTVIDIILVEC